MRKIKKVWRTQSIIERRKGLAMTNQRSFSLEFKHQVVEELMSGGSRACPALPPDDMAPNSPVSLEETIQPGKFHNEFTEEEALRNKIGNLKRLAGKLAPDKEGPRQTLLTLSV